MNLYILRFTLSFLILTTTSFASNLVVTLDKELYSNGDRVKITAIVKPKAVNSDFEFIVEGELLSNGISSYISFQNFGNIFLASTKELFSENHSSYTARLKLKLQNTKNIRALTAEITLLQGRIEELMRSDSPLNAAKISELNQEIQIYQKEILEQSTLIEVIDKVIPLKNLACDFESYEEINVGENEAQVKTEFSADDFINFRSHAIEKDGHTYEVQFLVSKKNRKIKKMPKRKTRDVDYCTTEYEPDLSDDMLPSWTLGRSQKSRLFSEYESSVRCTTDDQPVKCKFRVSLSSGLCDGRHSLSHSGTRPLGYFTNLIENFTYDVPATAVGKPYTYIAPDIAGDVVMNFVTTFPDGSVFETPYTLRVYVPGLVNLNDTIGLSEYLEWDVASHANLGSYGVPGFGLFITLALRDYTESAYARGIPNVSGENQFSPLSSGGVSLQFGGLLDTQRNWSIPHRRHRQGVDMDIGMNRLTNHTNGNLLKQILDRRLRNYGFVFDVNSESIVNSEINHWHIRYPYGEVVDSNGGR